MSRNTTFVSGEYYHVYNRGTDKRLIFTTSSDRERFLALLYLCNSEKTMHVSDYQGSTLPKLLELERGEPLVDICAYCLMPNHFHLLVRELAANGISRFMQKLGNGYTGYFNKRFERSGGLFQGKFKAEHAGDDRYLKYLISYIHLNPVKLLEPTWKETGIQDRAAAEMYLQKYPYSSFHDYCGIERSESRILNTLALPAYFETPKDFQTNVLEWLDNCQGRTLPIKRGNNLK